MHFLVFLASVHTFSAWQELIAAANFHPGKIPRRARWHTLALRRQPGEPGPRESLYPPSAQPLCVGWGGPARVLDAVWRAVWAEDGLHPPSAPTGRAPPGSVSGSDAQDELCLSTATSTSRTRPPLTLWPHSASLLVPVWRPSQCC